MMKRRIRRGDPQKQRYWEEAVRRWREGGQSVRDFCRGESLQESTFYFWRRELTRRGQKAKAGNGSRPQVRPMTAASMSSRPARRRGPGSPPRGPAPSFLPVHVVEHGVAEATRGVEIVLSQGRVVRVRAGFDRQTLVDVLAVLEVRPC
jgi:transposase-like protein